VRRELWETRSIYLAPLAAAVLALAGFLISLAHLPAKMRAASGLDPMKLQEIIEQPYHFAELLIMGATFIVAIFYCLEALAGERRDRSILFWKSMPVSDLTVVLSKASVPILILPLITVAITIVTEGIMVLLSSAVLAGNGLSACARGHLSLSHMWLGLLFHLIFIHGLGYAPFWCWMILVSGWARRAAFVWAVLPPLGIAIVEKIAFNTSYFAGLLKNHFLGGGDNSGFPSAGMAMEPLPNAIQFLASLELWIGLAIAAAFLVTAVRLRRYRAPL
jgi:ABC-2 type transport system permease protein